MLKYTPSVRTEPPIHTPTHRYTVCTSSLAGQKFRREKNVWSGLHGTEIHKGSMV